MPTPLEPFATADQTGERVSAPGAPVLLVPDVFEPAFCRTLIEYYDRVGGEETGVMRSLPDGRTVDVLDPDHKRRSDATVVDPELRAAIRSRLERQLVPPLRRAYQFRATRIERYLVARYAAERGGHFRAHRDNTTRATAHRRFAVTINLDATGYTGGELRFPEYDRNRYHAPTGAALVFSCSMLHEVLPVTSGARYCCLPFLYDEEAAAVRQQNR
jgi:predicted 2-oxoglutarate/Fe(II)-dependent dioxygenase YbiX